jgi:hypothetical protein
MKPLIIAIALSGIFFAGLAVDAVADDCAALADSYASALDAARACGLAVPDSCAASRPGSLRDVCRCQVAVNPSRTDELDRLAAKFKAQSCPYDKPFCTRACTIPVHTCIAASSTSSCDDH